MITRDKSGLTIAMKYNIYIIWTNHIQTLPNPESQSLKVFSLKKFLDYNNST